MIRITINPDFSLNFSCECLQKFVRLFNVNRNSDIGAIAPTGWEAKSEECEEVNTNLSERSLQDLSTQVATQELRKVEDTMNFESNEFSISDLTELEIVTIFTDKGETKALAPFVDLRPAEYRNSKAEDKAASLSARYGLPLSEPQLEQLRINGIPEKTCAQTEWGVRVWNDWASERNSKSKMLASIPIDFVEAARIEQLDAYLCYFVTEIR